MLQSKLLGILVHFDNKLNNGTITVKEKKQVGVVVNKRGMFLYSACNQSVGPLKARYTSPPVRPVYSDTNSTPLESIQPCFK